MFLKMVKNDCYRKKIVTATIFIFITMAVILGASATNIIANLTQSMSELQERAHPADITQMHAGDYNQRDIDKFTEEQREHIAMQETMVLLTLDGNNIHFGNNNTMAGTVQDISFVVQNKSFDYILDLNNNKLDVKEGTVAVPIYFMQQYDLKVGETITVKRGDYEKDFTISDYARDYEMNSSLTSSKRFVINQSDYNEMLVNQVGEREYLIQFKLHETGDAQAVQTAYIDAGLPANGPTVGGKIFLIFNAMSDTIVAMVIILISILLIIIASLCIRLTFLATIDEDLREIGVMKAIGISKKDIKKVYLNKYRAISVVAGIVGYLLSFVVVNLFTGNMRLYISSDLSGNLKYVLSLIAPLFVYFIITLYFKKVLKRIDKISAVEALRSDIMQRGKNKKYSFSLLKNKFFSTNIYMGIRDVFKRFKLYRLLIVIFVICTFIIILPISVYNTMNSPEFSTYMGVGKSDMRIDLRKTDTITEDYKKLQEELANDPDIEKYAAYITGSFQVKNTEGAWDYINIETGDFSVFPLSYLEGNAPKEDGEIALSYANASKDGLDKKVGDTVIVKVAGAEKKMTVSGIYQDITNGGKTAKATTSLELNENAILWYIVNMDVAKDVNIPEKMEYYQSQYASAQVNDIKEYTQQTLGNIISQMSTVVIGGIAISLIIIVLITALFLRMLLSKDMSQIAIMRSMGLTANHIKQQYMAGTLLVLIVGIFLGVLVSNYLGEYLVSMGMSSMGAAKIELVNVAWQTWLLCPLALIVVVGITISVCCKVTVKDDLSVILKG
ncbi:ABC transporter permease [Lysinibacillus sphaericus]|uniref:Peptide ABC transporter permease n=1 Tax=Lysinibacillus sphaericus TaxID=1421 RepID=A0A2S0K387_LYSSH|nr:FtsX-like permease family protein [Lysinibacillus sphaericus]AVK97840.1 peptide ABC transporter permease [Lysinibacillus sphaericus]MED4543329.1 FtsX-like permease family protein [Lysinibacillus sphaericus]TKI21074.1 ABC transporter permease [Lysinibacillus sphaericus]SUV16232.1 peptide ABC transporter permease [Lysinibacillus sphaericus]GEC81909.1 ABC transporter permease [Lysinibacillus sphaericus]